MWRMVSRDKAPFVYVALAFLIAAGCILIVSPPTLAQNVPARDGLRIVEHHGPVEAGPPSPAQKRALSQGYLVPDQQAYENAKVHAAQRAKPGTTTESGSAAPIKSPTSFRSFQGLRDPSSAPSDSTGAVGPGRYIELVNTKFGIYKKTSNTPIAKGTLNGLAGASPSEDVFDPQIIWDPTTKRFYYVMDDVVSASQNLLAFGFSRTASPSSGGSADWCKYYIDYGSTFPDYPKLGDTSGLALIGVNTFSSSNVYLGSDLISITKPPSGTSCPDKSTFTVDSARDLKDVTNKRVFTPLPANQTDSGGTGYVVAVPNSLPATSLKLYQVTENPDGTMNLGVASNIVVPSYTTPSNAAQRGTTERLDTLDARITQAVSAVDPSRGTSGQTALWTQHTVFGGAGAEVRWYEIDPSILPNLFQSGIETDPSRYIFNGAISPDRQVNDTTSRFGRSMVLGFNSSSTTQFPDIRMVSKRGANSTSGEVRIKASPASLTGFDCPPLEPCRWGDYAAATPDPATPSTAARGRVWLSSQWVRDSGTGSSSGWGSWNWAVAP